MTLWRSAGCKGLFDPVAAIGGGWVVVCPCVSGTRVTGGWWYYGYRWIAVDKRQGTLHVSSTGGWWIR